MDDRLFGRWSWRSIGKERFDLEKKNRFDKVEIETKLVVRSEARTFGRGTSTTTKRFVWFSLNFSIRWSKEIRSFFEKENKARPNEPPRQNRFITEKPIYFHSIIDNYRYKGEGGNYP